MEERLRLPPAGAWCRNTRECLAILLRPGNAGSNTFTDHKEVLAAALRQVPSRFRRKAMVRVDGAGASHDLMEHLLSLNTMRKTMLFTTGWVKRDIAQLTELTKTRLRRMQYQSGLLDGFHPEPAPTSRPSVTPTVKHRVRWARFIEGSLR